MKRLDRKMGFTSLKMKPACDGLIGIGCLDDFKSGVLDRLGGIQPQQELVFHDQITGSRRAILFLRSAKRLGEVLFRFGGLGSCRRRVHHDAG